MELSGSVNETKDSDLSYPALAAQKFIRLFASSKPVSDEEQAMLAAAYYTLSIDQSLSINRSNMHVNSAIVLLKNINSSHRKVNWYTQIAHAYFKRAELLEEKNSFHSASIDYQQVIDSLEASLTQSPAGDKELLLLARAALSIADLIVHEHVNRVQSKLAHPLFYVNKALEYLADIQETNDDVWTTHAYAHQIAGITLSHSHFAEAQEAFRVALMMLFKTESTRVSPLLADIYTCLGLLYEQQYHAIPVKHCSESLLDQAMIYFGLSLVFSHTDSDDESPLLALESLFEIIYRVLDPYLAPLNQVLIFQLVDALLYSYMCIMDKMLPNETLAMQLDQPETLDVYAQHIYWLVMEAFNKRHPRNNRLEIQSPSRTGSLVDSETILNMLEEDLPMNVYPFPKIIEPVE